MGTVEKLQSYKDTRLSVITHYFSVYNST